MTSPSGQPVIDALQRLLASHHAAVYGYPLIGIRLAEQGQIDQARTLEAAHRIARDAVRDQLAALGAEPVAAQVSYQPAAPVTDPTSAQRWAIELELDCAAGYRYLLVASAGTPSDAGPSAASSAGAQPSGGSSPVGSATSTLRSQALTGLTDAAGHATSWRQLLQPNAPTIAFPGL